MSDPLVRVALWRQDGDLYRWVTDIGRPTSFGLEPRHNAPGVWSLDAGWNLQAAKIRRTDLVTFDFRQTRVTGILTDFGLEGTTEGGVRFTAESNFTAFALLGDAACWPDPNSPVDEQNVVAYRRSGPTETVVKDVVSANLERLGYPVHVVASQGRGITTRTKLQFKSLLEFVQAKCGRAGLGASLGLVDVDSVTARLEFDIFEPTEHTGPGAVVLSPPGVPGGSGSIRSWKMRVVAPTATRAIVWASQEETTLTIGSVNTSLNRLTIAGKDNARHRLRTGDIVRFTGKGTPPAPLEDNRAYFAIRVDADTFSVARTRDRALQGLEIDLTNAGSGTLKVTETQTIRELVVRDHAEAVWGRKIETVVKTGIEDDENEDVYTERGNEALDEAVAQSAFQFEAAEPVAFKYAEHLFLGDVVRYKLPGDIDETDRLRAAQINFTNADGLTVDLTVGNPDARPQYRLAAQLRGLRRQSDAAQREES